MLWPTSPGPSGAGRGAADEAALAFGMSGECAVRGDSWLTSPKRTSRPPSRPRSWPAGRTRRRAISSRVREAPGDFTPGSYLRRTPEQYDRGLCLIPDDVLAFVYATQPKEWEKFKKLHGADAKRPVAQAARLRGREARHAGRAAQGDQERRLQVPAGLLPPGQRAERGDRRSSTPANLFAISPPAALQPEEREQPGPGPLPERPAHLHRGAEEPAHRPERRRTPSASTASTATPRSRSSPSAAAWPTSPSTPTWST